MIAQNTLGKSKPSEEIKIKTHQEG